MKFTGKTVLITGASAGIGATTARFFAAEGANLVLVARREERLHTIAQEIEATFNVKTLVIPADISLEEDVRRVFRTAEEQFSSVDILINNAGFGFFRSATEIDMEDFDRLMNVNVRGVVLGTKYALPGMIARKEGTIVNIVSIAGKNAVLRGSVYAASKFAVKGFAESVFMEVREHNIRVVNIYPGSVATEFFDVAEYKHPNLDKALRAEDIAETILLACRLQQNATITELEIRPTNPR